MNQKTKTILFFLIGAIAGMLAMYLFSNYKLEKKNRQDNSAVSYQKSEQNKSDNSYSYNKNSSENSENSYQNSSENSGNIAELTKEEVVVPYVKEHHELPDYYITKSEAKRNGWNPGESLCEAVPGKAIGGDHFRNKEGKFPEGEQYFEADVNYNCGHRNAERIVFTKNGDVWITHDHYKSFQKQ